LVALTAVFPAVLAALAATVPATFATFSTFLTIVSAAFFLGSEHREATYLSFNPENFMNLF